VQGVVQDGQSTTPPRPKGMASRLLCCSSRSSAHPTCDEPWRALCGSHDPKGSYHGSLSASRDRGIQAPVGSPGIRGNSKGLAGTCGSKQSFSQPGGIAAPEVEGLAENSSLVSAARVRWAQAIVLDLADVEESVIAVRQARRHHGMIGFTPGMPQGERQQ